MTNNEKHLIFNEDAQDINKNKFNSNKTLCQETIFKNKLKKEYNISEEDIEKIIKKLEERANDEYSTKKTKNKTSIDTHSNQNNLNITPTTTNKEKKEKYGETQQNVDNLLSNIIPNYHEEVSIELEHVNLTFNIVKDRIDTLKELFIKTVKRNKSERIQITALKDITFKINKGEKIGIIGYNGAGKSTLLNVISGIYPPDSGKVKTNGNISPLLSLGAGFDHNYSGRKNIYLNGAILGYDKKLLEEKLDEIIEFSELGEYIDMPIKNYSSGMLAKLGFSIATAVNPDILIIDEILSVGDVNFQKKSRDKMKSLMDGDTTVLLVSHSIPQIRELCDKAIWIDNGRVREIGDVNIVCDNYLKDSEKASAKQLENIQIR